MTHFKAALSAPKLHFKRLRSAEPLRHNDAVVVRLTQYAFESEILWEGRRFLIHLPRRHDSIRHIEELEIVAQERSRGPLIECLILSEEVTLTDSLGHKHLFDVVLQELPEGESLRSAVNHYCTEDLRAEILRMAERLDSIGFRHGNLTPSNVIICKSGVARPIRYWHAKWEVFSENNISQLMEFIDKNSIDTSSSRLIAEDCQADYRATSTKYHKITRVCKGHHYGFIDCDGRQLTPFIYSWVSEFREGRAVVMKSRKMGAIDDKGRKVIPVIYRSLEFDIKTGFFNATNDRYRYLINYEGEIIRRTKLEAEESVERNIKV